MNRRHILCDWATAFAAVALGVSPIGRASAECRPTESDSLGPFYVSNTPVLTDINRFGKLGEPMRVVGRVLSAEQSPRPIANAIVEIWQTDGKGHYYPQANGDASRYADRELDLRGTVRVGADGEFSIVTVVPGAYAPRPRHIHYRVSAPGFKTLVTQHYLSDGEPVPGGVCRSGAIERPGGQALFRAPAFYLAKP